MNKKLTACLLSLAIVCAVLPTASANNSISGKFVPTEGILTEQTKEMKVSGKVIEPKILSQKEHEKLVISCEPDEEIIMSCNYFSEPEETSTNYGEYLTNNFSTYGAQLPNLIYQVGTTTVNVGSALQQMYNNMKADIEKGTSSAIFRGDTSAVKKLGVTISLPNIDKRYYDSLAKDMCWTVYRCIDSDLPEMFYSNGYCQVAYSVNGNNLTLYSLPLYRAGFTTLEQRISLKKRMDDRVKELVKESDNYPTAYDKIQFFHDWLCENNTYNHAAVESTTYSANVSGSPWSVVGALLSNSDSNIPGPVCEAYSRAFQLLCRKIGMTATVIVSESGQHMWNNVRYGQLWTGVDVTWDDSSGTHDYFCQKVNNISGHRMDDNDFSTWLSYPELSVVSGSGDLPFYDVSTKHWAREAIQYVYDGRYINGMNCVTFGVNDKVTRAQFATILYSIAGRPEITYVNQFTDVPAGKWYTDAILWAYQNQITIGYPDGSFGIYDPITREQLAAMLHQRNLMMQGDSDEPENPEESVGPDNPTEPENPNESVDPDNPAEPENSDESDGTEKSVDPQQPDVPLVPIEPEPPKTDGSVFQKFVDADMIDSWAYTAISWAIENNIINGYKDGTLKPLGDATRSECAVMISKIA